MKEKLKLSDLRFCDMEVFFKEGGSMVIPHKEFLDLVESIKLDCKYHVFYEEPLENQKVATKLLSIDSIKYTDHYFKPK